MQSNQLELDQSQHSSESNDSDDSIAVDDSEMKVKMLSSKWDLKIYIIDVIVL